MQNTTSSATPELTVPAATTSTIEVSFPGGKRVAALVDGFQVMTDQPVSGGGEGAAPAPFDLYLASLATCAGIYALGFCQARGLSTEGLRLRQLVEQDPETRLPTAIRLELTPPLGFPEKYLGSLTRVVAGCKVKKSIASPPSFSVELAPAVG